MTVNDKARAEQRQFYRIEKVLGGNLMRLYSDVWGA
jgi:hypothetical protein